MKYLLFLLGWPCTLLGQNLTYPQMVNGFVQQWKEVAISEMNRTGIPASVTLAQGIIESNAGHSPLAADASNFFGIKCHSDWKGKTYTYTDDKPDECFRSYDDPKDSWKDHSDFLKNQSRYNILFTYGPTDYKKWCNGLKDCGYATNPKYPEILINCIEHFNLHQYDLSGNDLVKWQQEHPQPAAGNDSALVKNNSPYGTNIGTSAVSSSSTGRTLLFNDIKMTLVKQDESLASIAKWYGLSEKRLRKYNDWGDEPVNLHPGDKIYLQPKRLRGDAETHMVQEGETMWFIAQQHGIRLSELYDKNLMTDGQQPATGAVLSLKNTVSKPPPLATAAQSLPEKQVASPSHLPAQQIPASGRTYLVKSGDTLYSISKKLDTTVDSLKTWNHLVGNTIYVGQTLKVQ